MSEVTIGISDPLYNFIGIVFILVGALWSYFKIIEYREFKQIIQFEIDANLYPINSIKASIYSWSESGEKLYYKDQDCTHVVEVLLKFINKGKKRFRLYNLQASIRTMPKGSVRTRDDDGRLSLETIMRSGNLVPEYLKSRHLSILQKFKYWLKRKTPDPFYYIEPGVEQTITYLALIRKPRDLLQVRGKFSLEEERIFPENCIKSKKLFPHTAERTYKIDPKGNIERKTSA